MIKLLAKNNICTGMQDTARVSHIDTQ